MVSPTPDNASLQPAEIALLALLRTMPLAPSQLPLDCPVDRLTSRGFLAFDKEGYLWCTAGGLAALQEENVVLWLGPP